MMAGCSQMVSFVVVVGVDLSHQHRDDGWLCVFVRRSTESERIKRRSKE